MKKPPARKHGKTPAARPATASRLLLPTLAAVGGGLAAGPAAALELGELKLHSTLGQPLRASIPYAVGPSEQIGDYCVSLRAGQAANGLPTLTRARILVADGVISLTGTTAMREPLMTTRIIVKCPYTPQLSRDYLIFVDPPGFVAEPVSENPRTQKAPIVPLTPVAPVPEALPAVVVKPRRRVNDAPIQGNSRYRVQPGDSLSAIVQRLENRQINLWDAVYAVFDANPDAFIDSDPNKLKAGSWLVIPNNAIANAIATNARIEAPVVAEYAQLQPEANVVESPVVEAETISEVEPVGEPELVAIEVPQVAESGPDYSTLRPGDIVLDSNRPFLSGEISAGPETIVIPETELEEPVLTASSNGPVASTTAVVAETSKLNWTSWLIGGAIALFAGLFLFGRKLRERFGSAPIGASQQQPSCRNGHDETQAIDALADVDYETQAIDAVADVDYDIDDDSPTYENLVLDADLIAGTGLTQKSDRDINQDFGFAVTTQLDIEIPARAALDVDDEAPSTVVLPPLRAELESILESEVLPEDDDYDMSIVVDATKIQNTVDVTSRDFRAVAIENDDEMLDADDYTISQEVDYDIVEDKFADQFSTTQALSDEIEKAAAELAERIAEQKQSEDDEPASIDSTAMQLGSVCELDVTVNLPAENDVIRDLDDTGINEAVTVDQPIDDDTVEMPSADDELTAALPFDDTTVEMLPSADDERTVEMVFERGNEEKKVG